MAWVVPILGLVASVASTGYSIYSSEESKSEARHERRKQERALAQQQQLAETQAEEARKAERLKRARLGKKQTWLTKGMDLGTPTVATAGLKSTLGG
jgi:Tfp pilus assembly protein PilE